MPMWLSPRHCLSACKLEHQHPVETAKQGIAKKTKVLKEDVSTLKKGDSINNFETSGKVLWLAVAVDYITCQIKKTWKKSVFD